MSSEKEMLLSLRPQAHESDHTHIISQTGDRGAVQMSRQSQADRYQRELNEMLAQGHLPNVHFHETVSASDGDKTITAHFNGQGKIDRIKESDIGHEGSYDLNAGGRVTRSISAKKEFEHGMGFKLDSPIITTHSDEMR